MNMAAIARDHFARIVEIPLPALLATRLAGAVALSLCNVGPARQWRAELFARVQVRRTDSSRDSGVSSDPNRQMSSSMRGAGTFPRGVMEGTSRAIVSVDPREPESDLFLAQ